MNLKSKFMEFKENKRDGLISNDEYTEKPTKQKLITSIVICLGLALAFLWFTRSLWSDFTAMENGDKDLEVHSIIYFMYQIGGKWLACGFFAVCAIFFIYQGIKWIMKIKNKDY